MQDLIERRKQQNRARQSAWRKRRKTAGEPNTTTTSADSAWRGHGILIASVIASDNDQRHPATPRTSLSRTLSLSNESQIISTCQAPQRGATPGAQQKRHLIPPLLPYAKDTPHWLTPAIIFPLSPDHSLITIVQYNVVRAMLVNMSILSLFSHLPSGCTLAFSVPSLFPTPPAQIPTDLQPTFLQKCTPHPFWISAIPFPALRDNMIRATGTYDSVDLCLDLGQAVYEGFDDVERRGCLVWREAWCGRGWEVTEGFARKWGFLLGGCEDVITSTNYWRELRGEEKLMMEV